LPLILTADQYVTHREGRHYLFRTFDQWAYEYPVIFVGHGLQDSDIRGTLLEVSKNTTIRPRHFLVKPNTSAEETRFWESKKITVLNGTFEDFLTELDRIIPRGVRPLLQKIEYQHPIINRFVVNEALVITIQALLTRDADYVYSGMSVEDGKPGAFYKGFDLGWFPIERNLDVRRILTDTLLNDVIIRSEDDRPTVAELYAIKAEAGAGKSVFLRRLAWDAATQSDALCLFARKEGSIRYEALQELHRVTQQRIFLFFDDAADNVSSLLALITKARREKIPLTIITAERINAWNMSCVPLNQYLSEHFLLRYLSRTEIGVLVKLLEEHDSLGPNLINKTHEERVEEFHEQAGRQLLVALHEATLGPPFEEILFDEFNEIQPPSARSLYLTVCVLNRMKVPVRAGLIARVHQIPFDQFREQLFAPLEHVVRVRLNSGTGDYFYTARHPEIAQIVFERALSDKNDRYHEYVRILRELNPAYSSDKASLRDMVRAKTLDELFPDFQDVRSIFDIALTIAPRDAYIYQQKANYERIRPSGNYSEAHKLLRTARGLDPKDTTIAHTLAELVRTQAESAEYPLERERFRSEAKKLLQPLLGDQVSGRYARHTMVKLALDHLRDVLDSASTTDREVDEAIRAIETPLQRWQQEHPDDHFLLTAESDFSHLLRDSERSLKALKRAFAANPRDRYVTTRLARVLEDGGKYEEARDTLHAALDSNRGDKQLNFRYAMVLRKLGQGDHATLIHHLRRAFTQGDQNFEAQFWFARYAFEARDTKDREESRKLFRRLRDIPMAHEDRHRIRDQIIVNDRPTYFQGSVAKIEAVHGFIERDGIGDWLFFHRNNMDEEFWDTLRPRMRVAFNIGFSYAGVRALNVEATGN
jgi:tetratricopeptide (TPR) repeat protein